jgi:hypothetical protein
MYTLAETPHEPMCSFKAGCGNCKQEFKVTCPACCTKQLQEDIKDLQLQVNKLSELVETLWFMPGGPAFQEAKTHFEENIKQ